MKWARVSINTSREYVNALSQVFAEAGIGGVLEEVNKGDGFATVTLTAYIRCDDQYQDKLRRLEAHVKAFELLGITLPSTELTAELIEEEDWAGSWKKYYKPFRLGRFVIKPGWEDYTPSGEEIVLELDPGMAFGTGQHPTTALCLGALEDYMKPGDTVIDAGTGSGILSIAADRLGAGCIYAFDCDSVAVETAAANFRRHGVNACLERAFNADHIPAEADLTLANIIAKVILYMADSLAARTRPGGILVASGIINTRSEEVREALEERGFELTEERALKEWVCLIMKKQNTNGAIYADR
ncbi:MAG: 50S ribosomal protein L11 methyltransferase [Abditibacteriota bacterium]|nr:50S ribosomal protein L11 methyltransferase [Abditibacteriota bacterium]